MLFQGLTRRIHVFSLQVRKRWEDLMVESQKKNRLGRTRRKGDLRGVRHGSAKLIMGPRPPTTNTWEEYSCLQRGSNPNSHKSCGCRATPYTARSLESLPILRIANMFGDFSDSLYLFLETCFCDCVDICYVFLSSTYKKHHVMFISKSFSLAFVLSDSSWKFSISSSSSQGFF